MDICIAENLKKHWVGREHHWGAELSIGWAEGQPKSIQIDTSVLDPYYTNYQHYLSLSVRLFILLLMADSPLGVMNKKVFLQHKNDHYGRIRHISKIHLTIKAMHLCLC